MGSETLRDLNNSTATLIYGGGEEAASKDKRGVPSLSCHHILELDPNHNSTDSKTYPTLYMAHLVPLYMEPGHLYGFIWLTAPGRQQLVSILMTKQTQRK